jgi:hypothetical protein
MNKVENKSAIEGRATSVQMALASVRAEGLEPSEKAIKIAEKYAAGKIDGKQFQHEIMDEALLRAK